MNQPVEKAKKVMWVDAKDETAPLATVIEKS